MVVAIKEKLIIPNNYSLNWQIQIYAAAQHPGYWRRIHRGDSGCFFIYMIWCVSLYNDEISIICKLIQPVELKLFIIIVTISAFSSLPDAVYNKYVSFRRRLLIIKFFGVSISESVTVSSWAKFECFIFPLESWGLRRVSICVFLKFFARMSAEGISDKQKRVLELRKEYLKKLHNPYRHMTAEGGHIVSFQALPGLCYWLDNFSILQNIFGFSSIQRCIDSKPCDSRTTIISSPHSSPSRLDSWPSSLPSFSSLCFSNGTEMARKRSTELDKSLTRTVSSSSSKSLFPLLVVIGKLRINENFLRFEKKTDLFIPSIYRGIMKKWQVFEEKSLSEH